MPRKLEREVEKLKKMLLELSAVVEERLRLAVKSVEERDEDLARAVIDGDIEIDQMEVDLEEECLKVLALHQPVATDLRFIIAILKINSDLERIGDLALNIAERVALVREREAAYPEGDFDEMASAVRTMVRKSLDALVNLDSALAREVITMDDRVDALHTEAYRRIETAIGEHDIDHIDGLIRLIGVSRNLERIADHATNIAEDVIYLVTGEIVRHRVERP